LFVFEYLKNFGERFGKESDGKKPSLFALFLNPKLPVPYWLSNLMAANVVPQVV
jgi:hypothetical protein